MASTVSNAKRANAVVKKKLSVGPGLTMLIGIALGILFIASWRDLAAASAQGLRTRR